MSGAAIRILVVEDDPAQQQAARLTLRSLGYEVVGVAPTADDALRRFDEEQPDLVLLDVSLAGSRDGIALGHELIARRPVPLIFLTAFPDADTFERARRVGPFAFLGKPYNGLLLGHSIALALQHFALALGLPDGALTDGAVLLGGVFVREPTKQFVKIPFAELLVIEADASYTHLHTTSRKFTIRTSLRELEERLPADQFARIHRTYVVQVARIETYDPQTSTLHLGAHALPLARSHRDEVLGRLAPLR